MGLDWCAGCEERGERLKVAEQRISELRELVRDAQVQADGLSQEWMTRAAKVVGPVGTQS